MKFRSSSSVEVLPLKKSKKKNTKSVKKWHDHELRNIYIFVQYNFPYIFYRRMVAGELQKYDISQEQAEEILRKIAPNEAEELINTFHSTPSSSVIISDCDLSTSETMLGKRSPNFHRDSIYSCYPG